MQKIYKVMANESVIKLFEGKQVRIVWDEEQEKYYFSVLDIVQVLTDSADAKQYIKRLRTRDAELNLKWGTICTPVEMEALDGKRRKVQAADLQGIFRIIQSVPSKKAEPMKRWLAQVGSERIQQMIDPERSIQQAVEDYRKKGYSENWINQRVKTIEVRKGLTDEWKRAGLQEGRDFAILTDLITKAWSGKTTKEYKHYKGLTKENLRDNMTNIELALNTLAEASTTEISKRKNPKTMMQNMQVAKEGGDVAKAARNQLEATIGESVVSPNKAIYYIKPQDELPFDEEQKNEKF